MDIDKPSSTLEIPQQWQSCKITNLPQGREYPDPSAICHYAQVEVSTGTPTGDPGLTIKKLPYAEPHLEKLASYLAEFEGATIEWEQ